MTIIKYNQYIIRTMDTQERILDILENHKILHNFQCRHGICGICRCKIKKGLFSYQEIPVAFTNNNEILICIARANSDIEIET